MLTQLWRQSLAQRQALLKQKNLWRHRQQLDTAQQTSVLFANPSTESLINFSSNDYLGLANHPKVRDAMRQGAAHWGAGSGASHLVCGHQTPHHNLEEKIADFVGAERALLFSTGYMANLAVPASLLSKHDLLLQDKLNHASLLDAAHMSNALFKRYKHASASHADSILVKMDYEKMLITTDGVFSMDGDIAPLGKLKQLADKHEGVLLVDDAHGFGVVGSTGRGSLELHQLSPTQNTLLLGTLGKAVGCFGAFVAGDALLIEQLLQTARTYIYTTALPPAVALATDQSLSIINSEEGRELRHKVGALVNQFQTSAAQLGLTIERKVVEKSDTPIQPLVVGDEQVALDLQAHLIKSGFYVTAIRPPTIPKGTARLRFTLSAAHSEQQVESLFECLDSPQVRTLLSRGENNVK